MLDSSIPIAFDCFGREEKPVDEMQALHPPSIVFHHTLLLYLQTRLRQIHGVTCSKCDLLLRPRCCSLNPDSILAPHCRLLSVDEASVLSHIPMIGEKPLLPALYLEMPKDHRLCLPALCRLLVADGLPVFAAALLSGAWITSFLRLRGSITSGV
ncbi:hypothetical protein CONLIGDRAFT_634734 [Coniochaeta ligniaria NRRL 30616]|uniref:Uncharacterized protein n=1 Tax=Coniochaeta ligniaria NRRL 30616 TaxID=1408157 RepID=A0A1J7IGD3_9PEZI|nr:hypothetical protein CONLIGDRAFT_634734 [Coniochaeta ligniaria NRRL 30616]